MKKRVRSSLYPPPPRPLRLRIETQPEEVRVEVVPLIDVIFCILTFFILAAVGFSRQQAISVDLPKASTGTPQGREILMVSLNDLGQVFVEQDPVATKEQLTQKLQIHRQQNPLGLIALYASPNASYNDVVQVLDLLREVGGDRVALATLPKEGQQPPSPNPGLPPTGVPGFSPNPGQIPTNPDGTLNPYGQPQLPANPGGLQPELPAGGLQPGNLPPSPGQPQLNPGSSNVPNSGLQPTPGQPQVNPGSSALPNSGAVTPPQNNTTVPQRQQP
ncbi:MAG TPA: biopolymer transporter ExbD [Cyanobacteria bacterium UBA8803]|nr:biopolymer transporter ExbD [Cyanobacteria bacterium UBA8803]